MTGRVSSSLRQGIWMMSFIGRGGSAQRYRVALPARPRAMRTRAATGFAKARLRAAAASAALVGFFVFPTYPNYD